MRTHIVSFIFIPGEEMIMGLFATEFVQKIANSIEKWKFFLCPNISCFNPG